MNMPGLNGVAPPCGSARSGGGEWRRLGWLHPKGQTIEPQAGPRRVASGSVQESSEAEGLLFSSSTSLIAGIAFLAILSSPLT